MGESVASANAEKEISPKARKARLERDFKRLLEGIFEDERTRGSALTADQAMDTLDAMLATSAAALDSSETRKSSTAHPRLPLRTDMVAFRRKIHHYAVDLYYDTYFPHRIGKERKHRRGAPRLTDEYLDQILRLTRKGMNPAQIAHELGHTDPGAKDRIRKQMDTAVKRYSDAAENIRKLGAQLRENATGLVLQPPRSGSGNESAQTASKAPARKRTRKQ